MDLSEYIKVCQSKEEYSFTWDELVGSIDKPATAIKKELTYKSIGFEKGNNYW